MSVYQNSSSSRFSLPRARHRSGSTGTVPGSPASSLSGDEVDPPRPHLVETEEHVTARRHSRVEATPRQRQTVFSLQQQQHEKQCLQIRSAQKVSNGCLMELDESVGRTLTIFPVLLVRTSTNKQTLKQSPPLKYLMPYN
jgi:hypothetical protein